MKKTPRKSFEATEERIENLPKWARSYIEHLERDTAYLQGQLDALTATEQPENSMISWSVGIDDDHWLPRHTTIRCHFAKNFHIDVGFRGGVDGPLLLYVNGSRGLRILPQASNSVYFNLEEW